MPLIQVKLIENVFTTQQKQEMIKKLTDAMVSIEGENMRPITWVIIENVNSGEWGIGGQPCPRRERKRWQMANHNDLLTAIRKVLH
jgi:4-oxalocrotonate tautomerase